MEQRAGIGERLFAGAGAAVCLGVLFLAATLTPDPAGHGTHTQIASWMTPCAWPVVFGFPCPTCGMTTAFAHAADGAPVVAFRTQPFGGLLALGAATGFWAALHGCLLGSRIGRVYGTLLRPRVLWVVVGLAAGAWGWVIATWPAV